MVVVSARTVLANNSKRLHRVCKRMSIMPKILGYSACADQYGIPETITTDQGSVFTSRRMQEFAVETRFKLLTSTPYYAQVNGQVEAANKEATNTTPFRLTFGHDVVLPVEIHLQSSKIQRQNDILVDQYWNMMLDELVYLDEERLTALDRLVKQKQKAAKAYNKKVKVKTFALNDYVWKVILPMDQKDKSLGKWLPNWEGPLNGVQIFTNNAYEIEELSLDHRVLKVNGKYLKKYRPMLQKIRIAET
ncbi:uncharacterized protein LOC131637856 [Vicia villosa]|uniref:uncharacterized protein LOC131637856 n=1 Tax=Vicia villosa TaxID=3911 RepID=UPI00273AD67E|nr:uncharacterized protein LOC131637856 [Vicia villosa]